MFGWPAGSLEFIVQTVRRGWGLGHAIGHRDLSISRTHKVQLQTVEISTFHFVTCSGAMVTAFEDDGMAVYNL